MWDWIVNYFNESFGLNKLDTAQGILTLVFSSINLLFSLFLAYRAIYLLVGCFGRKTTYAPAPKRKKYAFVIAARNEEKVIASLIDSIHKQDYPQELITIYIVADNCNEDDHTAEIARSLGCHVYERHDLSKQRKGYGLNLLFKCIEEECGIDAYDAYLFHDADNILSTDYVSKMNDAFESGVSKAFQGYTTSKNFETNLFSASQSISTIRNIVACDRARARFKRGTSIVGKGFMLSSELMKEGWNFFGLAEDGELTMKLVSEDVKVMFVEEAVFFDEQPLSFRISWRQRTRWSKGMLIVFFQYMGRLLASIFKKPTWEKYDMWWNFFPYGLFMFVLGLAYNVASLALYLCGSPGYTLDSFWMYIINSVLGVYLQAFFTGILICIRERKNIYCPVWKEILYIFAFGFYDLLNIPITILSLFQKVTWKTIPHVDDAKIDKFHK